MKYLSEEDEQHVAEDYQGPPGASLRFAEARGSAHWTPGEQLVALLVANTECPTCKGGLERDASDLFHIKVWCPNCKIGAQTGAPNL